MAAVYAFSCIAQLIALEAPDHEAQHVTATASLDQGSPGERLFLREEVMNASRCSDEEMLAARKGWIAQGSSSQRPPDSSRRCAMERWASSLHVWSSLQLGFNLRSRKDGGLHAARLLKVSSSIEADSHFAGRCSRGDRTAKLPFNAPFAQAARGIQKSVRRKLFMIQPCLNASFTESCLTLHRLVKYDFTDQ